MMEISDGCSIGECFEVINGNYLSASHPSGG
jgi:hypothetical protein